MGAGCCWLTIPPVWKVDAKRRVKTCAPRNEAGFRRSGANCNVHINTSTTCLPYFGLIGSVIGSDCLRYGVELYLGQHVKTIESDSFFCAGQIYALTGGGNISLFGAIRESRLELIGSTLIARTIGNASLVKLSVARWLNDFNATPRSRKAQLSRMLAKFREECSLYPIHKQLCTA